MRSIKGLGKWINSVLRADDNPRLKTRGKTYSSQRRSLLPSKGQVSGLGESAAFHCAQMSFLDFGDDIKMSDKDHAVAKDAETLSVAGNDATRTRQEKEARTMGGILSQ